MPSSQEVAYGSAFQAPSPAEHKAEMAGVGAQKQNQVSQGLFSRHRSVCAMPFAMFQCAKSIVQSFTGIASEDLNDFISSHLEDRPPIEDQKARKGRDICHRTSKLIGP